LNWGEISFGLRGSAGWVKWEEESKSCIIKSTHSAWAGAPLRKFDVPTTTILDYGDEGRARIKAFAAAIRGEGSSGYTVEDASKSLQIIEAAHASAHTGKMVE
jgi:predicted dehydrogenase